MGKCLSDDRIECVHDLNVIFIFKFLKIHVQLLTLIGQLVKMDEKMFDEWWIAHPNDGWNVFHMDGKCWKKKEKKNGRFGLTPNMTILGPQIQKNWKQKKKRDKGLDWPPNPLS